MPDRHIISAHQAASKRSAQRQIDIAVVAFDCLRCPVAEYFASHNLSELCVKTFCNPDFPLAEQWGAKWV